MCGRFTQKQLARRYVKVLLEDWEDEIRGERPPTWNLAPTAVAWVIRAIDEGLAPKLFRWGFGYDAAVKQLAPINARIETADQKQMFRDAWKTRRCVVPADGWYEWREEPGGRQPFYFAHEDHEPVFFAGIWIAETFCLFTTASNGDLAQVHHRRPVAFDRANALDWMRKGMNPEEAVEATLPPERIEFHPVSKAVSNSRVDGAQLIEKVTLPPAGLNETLPLFD
jgi:putative SOS response-associated peptidase YedK